MIWVIAGTQDGRQIAKALAELTEIEVLVTVVSDYGKLLAAGDGLDVQVGRLSESDMIKMIKDKKIKLVVDASHPYAAIASVTARAACARANTAYIRYERPEIDLPTYAKLHRVHNEIEAANLAGRLGEKIYLTTGSKTLKTFIKAPALQKKEVWARVLPTSEVIGICEELGLNPKYIVALQGPFSYEMNRAMFHDTKAQVVIMKNSGLVGGTDTKLAAAIDENVEIIIIDRPPVEHGDFHLAKSPSEIIKKMEEYKWNI